MIFIYLRKSLLFLEVLTMHGCLSDMNIFKNIFIYVHIQEIVEHFDRLIIQWNSLFRKRYYEYISMYTYLIILFNFGILYLEKDIMNTYLCIQIYVFITSFSK